MERLRYQPLGWSKIYEFNDSDLRFSSQVGFRWIENAANGRTHLRDDQIPWDAVKYLISNCIYGGRVDAQWDQRVLKSLTDLVFSPSFTIEDKSISAPNTSSFNDFKSWIDSLPGEESPDLLWLPKTSGKFLFIQQGNETLKHILSVVVGSLKDNSLSKRSNFIKLLLEQWQEKLTHANIPEIKNQKDSLISSVILNEICDNIFPL